MCGLPSAHAAPPLPAGTDPGGVAVAMIGDGVDYRDPAIARRLARDGEGVLIGRDVARGDLQPFTDQNSPSVPGRLRTTSVIRQFLPSAPLRVIAIRASDDLASLAQAIAFAAKTPARVVLLPMTVARGPAGELVREAARRFPRLLFVLMLNEEADGTRVADAPKDASGLLGFSNLLRASIAVDVKPESYLAEILVEGTGASDLERAEAAAAGAVSALACLLATRPDFGAAEARAALLALADPLKATGGRRVLVSPCPAAARKP